MDKKINDLKISEFTIKKYNSDDIPSNKKTYILITFDIQDNKKRRRIVKLLNSYGWRIQKSVFESMLNISQYKKLNEAITKLMRSKYYFNPEDNVRIYKIINNCDVTILGNGSIVELNENEFI